MFSNFAHRLTDEISALVGHRLAKSASNPTIPLESVKVAVQSHAHQRHAVFSGGALLASLPAFHGLCTSRQEYLDIGPSVCRQSKVFGSLLL